MKMFGGFVSLTIFHIVYGEHVHDCKPIFGDKQFDLSKFTQTGGDDYSFQIGGATIYFNLCQDVISIPCIPNDNGTEVCIQFDDESDCVEFLDRSPTYSSFAFFDSTNAPIFGEFQGCHRLGDSDEGIIPSDVHPPVIQYELINSSDSMEGIKVIHNYGDFCSYDDVPAPVETNYGLQLTFPCDINRIEDNLENFPLQGISAKGCGIQEISFFGTSFGCPINITNGSNLTESTLHPTMSTSFGASSLQPVPTSTVSTISTSIGSSEATTQPSAHNLNTTSINENTTYYIDWMSTVSLSTVRTSAAISGKNTWMIIIIVFIILFILFVCGVLVIIVLLRSTYKVRGKQNKDGYAVNDTCGVDTFTDHDEINGDDTKGVDTFTDDESLNGHDTRGVTTLTDDTTDESDITDDNIQNYKNVLLDDDTANANMYKSRYRSLHVSMSSSVTSSKQESTSISSSNAEDEYNYHDAANTDIQQICGSPKKRKGWETQQITDQEQL